MTTLSKLNNKQIIKSLVCFFAGMLGLYAIFLLTILMNKGGEGFGQYIIENSQPNITIAVSFAVLTAILYCYFFFENKYVLSRISKICELFLIMYIEFIFTYILSEYVDTLARPVAFLALMSATLFRRRDAIFINSVFAIMMLISDRILNLLDTNMYYCYASLLSTF